VVALVRAPRLHKTATQPVFQFSQYEHVLKAAAAGLGVAIGRTPLVLPLPRSGELEVLLPEHSAEGTTCCCRSAAHRGQKCRR
jgi:DNA-binding transcriptional LysR family regulator